MSLQVGRAVPAALADAEVLDAGAAPSRLGDRWAERPCVLVFLRHFGCIACTEHVAILAPRLHELSQLGVTVTYLGNGGPHFIAGFIERNAIDVELVEVVTDPDRRAYDAAGMYRSRWATAGPAAVAAYLRARLRGFSQERVEGDGLQQGGVVVLEPGGTVAFVHRDTHLGDHAQTNDVVAAAMRVVARGAPLA